MMYDFAKDRGKSNADLRDKYIEMARGREEMAIMRQEEVKQRAWTEISTRYPRLERQNPREFNERVTALTDIYTFGSKSTPGDPRYNGYVQDNQWYTRYATMYGEAAIADEMRSLRETINSLIRYLRERDGEERNRLL
jgi:hypothetical protein